MKSRIAAACGVLFLLLAGFILQDRLAIAACKGCRYADLVSPRAESNADIPGSFAQTGSSGIEGIDAIAAIIGESSAALRFSDRMAELLSEAGENSASPSRLTTSLVSLAHRDSGSCFDSYSDAACDWLFTRTAHADVAAASVSHGKDASDFGNYFVDRGLGWGGTYSGGLNVYSAAPLAAAAVVPEPASLALFGFGLLGVVLARRRLAI